MPVQAAVVRFALLKAIWLYRDGIAWEVNWHCSTYTTVPVNFSSFVLIADSTAIQGVRFCKHLIATKSGEKGLPRRSGTVVLRGLKPLRAKATEVPCFAFTFSDAFPGRRTLVSLGLDFEADALGLRGYRSCEAASASHSRVERRARMLPAGRVPDLPNQRRTAIGHTREEDLVDPGRRPETPSRGRAGLRRHRDTGASAATTAWERTGRSHDRTARVWCCAWKLPPGCRPCLQRCVSRAP